VSRTITLITRRDCGMCDDVAAALDRLRRALRFELRLVDVDADAALRREYNDVVPVVLCDGQVLAHAPVDAPELEDALRAALRSRRDDDA
jgi:predicted thioredoxin/glutaredoxin